MFQVWQAFVGVKARRVESYYQDLLDESELAEIAIVPEKTKKQIEKVIYAFSLKFILFLHV